MGNAGTQTVDGTPATIPFIVQKTSILAIVIE